MFNRHKTWVVALLVGLGCMVCADSAWAQPTGACCDANGGCTVRTDAECATQWIAGETCYPNPCPQPKGACCYLDANRVSQCAGNKELWECTELSGCWRGSPSSCTGPSAVKCSQVEIIFDPVQMRVQPQQEFQVGFRVRSRSGVNEQFATVQMIVQFDPEQLEILPPIPATGGTTCTSGSQCPANNYRCDGSTHKCVENPLVNARDLWGEFGFPMNGIGGPINADLTDGDAYFAAAAKLPPAAQPVATPSGLLMGWIRFRLVGTGTSQVTIPYTLGIVSSEVTDGNCASTGGLGILVGTGSFMAQADCNMNGVSDLTDIANGTSQDCNGNQTADECEISQASCGAGFFCVANCEPDCQHNCKIDECDISSGRSDDCQGDTIPDDCQNDCNCNGIDDSGETLAQICAGPGASGACDCNHNLRVDICDVTPGFCEPTCLPDVDGSGLPDVCEKCGDIDRNGTINIFDIFCVLDGYAGDFSICSKEACDLNGSCGVGLPECCPNDIINIFDIFSVLNAYQGVEVCCDT